MEIKVRDSKLQKAVRDYKQRHPNAWFPASAAIREHLEEERAKAEQGKFVNDN